jgi:hypothetical protein
MIKKYRKNALNMNLNKDGQNTYPKYILIMNKTLLIILLSVSKNQSKILLNTI